MENLRMDTALHRETDLENQMKTQAASHSFRDGSWLTKYETGQCEAWAVAQPRGTYIVIVRREALKPREGAGAVALNHAPEPAPQPDEQADKAEDNEELPQHGQNWNQYFGKHGIVTLVSVLQI